MRASNHNELAGRDAHEMSYTQSCKPNTTPDNANSDVNQIRASDANANARLDAYCPKAKPNQSCKDGDGGLGAPSSVSVYLGARVARKSPSLEGAPEDTATVGCKFLSTLRYTRLSFTVHVSNS